MNRSGIGLKYELFPIFFCWHLILRIAARIYCQMKAKKEKIGCEKKKKKIGRENKKASSCHFINVLHTTFTIVVPNSVKIQLSHKYIFMLSGSESVKAVRRTLMKLSPHRLEAFLCMARIELRNSQF